jgi:hypothetical protein
VAVGVTLNRLDDERSSPKAILGPDCAHFLSDAANTLGLDPATWTFTLVVTGSRLGQTLDQAIQAWLVGTRASLLLNGYTDPHLEARLGPVDALIQQAHDTPCSALSH